MVEYAAQKGVIDAIKKKVYLHQLNSAHIEKSNFIRRMQESIEQLREGISQLAEYQRDLSFVVQGLVEVQRRQRKIATISGVMKGVLNVFSYGVIGSVVEAAIAIVDFADMDHLQEVADILKYPMEISPLEVLKLLPAGVDKAGAIWVGDVFNEITHSKVNLLTKLRVMATVTDHMVCMANASDPEPHINGAHPQASLHATMVEEDWRRLNPSQLMLNIQKQLSIDVGEGRKKTVELAVEDCGASSCLLWTVVLAHPRTSAAICLIDRRVPHSSVWLPDPVNDYARLVPRAELTEQCKQLPQKDKIRLIAETLWDKGKLDPAASAGDWRNQNSSELIAKIRAQLNMDSGERRKKVVDLGLAECGTFKHATSLSLTEKD
eukprot:scaffold1531_cov296-Prasinococcus_capsulatus_cf.AAC.2